MSWRIRQCVRMFLTLAGGGVEVFFHTAEDLVLDASVVTHLIG